MQTEVKITRKCERCDQKVSAIFYVDQLAPGSVYNFASEEARNMIAEEIAKHNYKEHKKINELNKIIDEFKEKLSKIL